MPRMVWRVLFTYLFFFFFVHNNNKTSKNLRAAGRFLIC